ncbi:uncharacterized protein LOC121876967 [Homarus americanus]|uniref:Putative calcium-activated chloride channel regulator 4A-like 2 n=1 Tax=Homarus americanus TaxID=6706 RepID=A0A8J5JKE2_HOMAM|nr:uncharacterized protein LOC121876967 [Homarus americanus]KAG7159837.1 putative calcium-activated chloride channel regulator 4A-like 2 [Homarus americanus]
MSRKHSLLMEENFNDAGNDTLLLTQPESENMTNLLLEAGQRISLYLDLKEELHKDEIYYVALRAVDDVNKQSRVSNLALVVVPTADNNNNNNNSLPDWAIALIAIACVVLLGGLVAGIIHQMKKK